MASTRNRPPDFLAGQVARLLDNHQVRRLRVGLSGGLDSIVLIHLLARLQRGRDISLEALHVHHGLNPRAGAWADHCSDTCAALAIPLVVRRIRVTRQSGEGVEGEARRLRRMALAEGAPGWVALAHHRDDQAETVLANLLRGSGVLGAAAMPEADPPWLRPLLRVSRAELKEYAEQNGLAWQEDESNEDIRYTRNFLRHRILPVLEYRRPGIATRLAQAADRFAEAQHLLDELATIDLGGHPARFPTPTSMFSGLADARAANLLRYLLRHAGLQSPDEPALREFVRQLRTAGPDRHPLLRIGSAALEMRKGMIGLLS